jgi:hypothetical protein
MKNIVAFLLVFSSLFASSQTQYIGAPNTTVVARGNFKVDSILYLPKREKTPTDTGALRYQISDSSLYVWTGNAWRKAKNDGTLTSVSAGTGMSFTTITSTGSVSADTNVLATKSYRQKGDDSLGAIIATKGTGTVTSVGTGYGINGGTITTTGTLTADTLNLATRLRLQKVGDSLGVLISNAGGGTVTGVSAGTGMSFTTITSSGAVNADTLILSTRSWRQKGIDSVSSLIAAKVNISDTATMLSPYAKTSALGLYLPLSGGTLTGGLTGTTGAFTSSGGDNTFNITHSSGSGIALNISKGGNGEGLYVNKTSGSGNAATIIGTLNATTLVKSGGTSTQYLMADGTTSTLTNPVTGTGTTNRSVKFTGTSAVGNGSIADSSSSVQMTILSGGAVGVGTAVIPSNSKLHVENGYISTKGVSGGATAYILIPNSTNSLARSWSMSNAINTFGDFGIAQSNDIAGDPISAGTNRFYISRLGDVSIGNTAPSYKLDITGTLRNTTGAAFATSSGSVLVGTTTDAGQKLQVNGSTFITTPTYTNSSDLGLVVASGGNVPGINLRTASAGRFSIASNYNRANSTTFLTGTGTSNPTGEVMVIDHSTRNVQIGSDAVAAYKLDIAGDLRTTTGANFATSSGNVGVGTASPTFKLDVSAASGNGVRYLSTLTGQSLYMGDNSGTPFISSFGNYPLTFGVNNGEQIRIQGNGNIGIGTTADNGYKTDISGSLRNTTSAYFATTSGSVGIGNTAPSEKLHVTGRIRATTIDSTGTGTAMNMLYADATGVIKKAAVPSGGSGTVTSVATGFGLSGGTITTTGTLIVDSASVATRARVQKGVDSVATLTTAKVGGTGISGYFPKWTGTGTQDTSQLFQLGRNIGIGTASPTYRIHLPDAGDVNAQAMIAGTVLGSNGNGQTIRPSNSLAMTIFGQSDIGYIYGAAVSSTGRWGINTTSVNDATLSVDGSVKIVTVDSTSTARNMLYQDANGIIKKSAVPSGGVSGSGTTSYLPKWTSGTGLGNSSAYDNGGEILISTTEDAGDYKLQVAGAIYTTSTITTGGVNGQSVKPWKLGSRSAAAVTFDGTQYIEVEVNGVLYNLAVVTIN